MNVPLTVVTLAGSVALLLCGVRMVQTGVQRACLILMALNQFAGEKENFRNLETVATEAHFERLRSGRIDTAETSALHVDALRHLKDVNAHLVAGAAYPLLEYKGQLLASGLRHET